MGLTFWSFLVALAWCSIFILALTLFRKHVTLSGKHGAFALILVCVLCILRMFLSYDFSFSKGIDVGGVYTTFSDFMLNTTSAFDFFAISPWEIFLIIWGRDTVSLFYTVPRLHQKPSSIFFLPVRAGANSLLVGFT